MAGIAPTKRDLPAQGVAVSAAPIQTKAEPVVVAAVAAPIVVAASTRAERVGPQPPTPVSAKVASPSADGARLQALASYFSIRDAARVESALGRAGLQLAPVLEQYRDYVELVLTPDKGASGKVATLIQNVRTLIGQRVRDAAQQAIDDVAKGLAPNKWLANDRMGDALSDIAEPLLSSAKFYTAMTADPDYRRSIEELPAYKRDPHFKAFITLTMRQVEAELIDKVPTDIPSGLLRRPSFFDPNSRDKLLYARALTQHGGALEEFSEARDALGTLEPPSFLSAADRSTDARAKLTIMAAYLAQAAPYVGAAPSVAVDVEDLLSSSDATVSNLKRVGLLPTDYDVEKSALDRVMPAVSLAGTAVGLQATGRAGKVAKLARRLRRVDPTELERAAARLSDATHGGRTAEAATDAAKVASATTPPVIDWDKVDELQRTVSHHTKEIDAFTATLTHVEKSQLTQGRVSPELAARVAEITRRHATVSSEALRALGFDCQIVQVGSAGGYGVRIEKRDNKLWQRLRNSVALSDAGVVYAPFLLRAVGASMAKVGRNIVVGGWEPVEDLLRGRYGLAMRHELHHLKLAADLEAGRKTPFQASVIPTPGANLGLGIYDHHLSLEEISTYFREVRQHLWLRSIESRTGDPKLAEFRDLPTSLRTFDTLSRRSLEIIKRSGDWLSGEVARGSAGPSFRTEGNNTVTHLPIFDDAGNVVGNLKVHLVESQGPADPNNMRLLRDYLVEMRDAIASRRRRLAPFFTATAA